MRLNSRGETDTPIQLMNKKYSRREMDQAGWSISRSSQWLFASIFILVIASLVVQGWTVGSAARLLGFARRG